MPVTNAQLETIFRYFDGELSTDAEEQLLQQLRQDSDLQQAFDQQIMMRQFAPEETDAQPHLAPWEPAEAFLDTISTPGQNRQRTVPVIALQKRKAGWRVAASVVVLCLIAALTWYLFHKTKNESDLLVKTPSKDSIAKAGTFSNPAKDSFTQLPKPGPDATVDMGQLYADNHTFFEISNGEVLVAVHQFKHLYEQKRYPELSALSEKELEVKGGNDPDEEKLTAAYFDLYKGLANLEAGQLEQAETRLQHLLKTAAGNVVVSHTARWYLLLLYLKKGNRKKALEMADLITDSGNNLYYQKAMVLKQALQQNRQ